MTCDTYFEPTHMRALHLCDASTDTRTSTPFGDTRCAPNAAYMAYRAEVPGSKATRRRRTGKHATVSKCVSTLVALC